MIRWNSEKWPNLRLLGRIFVECSCGTSLSFKKEPKASLMGCQVAVHSVGEAMDTQRRGARARQKAATALNYASSRSHSIFTIAMFTADARQAEDREVRLKEEIFLLVVS